MNGLTVILVFVALLALFEEAVPRWRFRRWRRWHGKVLEAMKKRAAEVEKAMAQRAEKAAADAARHPVVEPEVVPYGRRIPAWKVRLVNLAQAGDADSMKKLGDLALKNGKFVEAYFWKWRMHQLTKMLVTNPTLRQIRRAWRKKKCPAEHQNFYTGFTEDQSAVIRAYMRFMCGIDPQAAREKIVAFAGQGVEEAKWMVEAGVLKEDKVEKDDEKEDENKSRAPLLFSRGYVKMSQIGRGKGEKVKKRGTAS